MEPDSTTAERQDRVVKALEDRSLRLAGMYRSAISTLRSPSEPGDETVRVSVVCHCMRELMLNLPSEMGDSVTERPKPSSSSLLAQLPSLLSKHSDLDPNADLDMVPVPKKVAQKFFLLIKTRTQENGINNENFAALVTGGSDARHPAIKQWKEAYGFFVKWAHLDQHNERGGRLPSDVDLLTSIRVVEDIIEVRTAEFFTNLHSVQDLLAEINASSGEGE